jgi:hypothetical protein
MAMKTKTEARIDVSFILDLPALISIKVKDSQYEQHAAWAIFRAKSNY